MTAVKYKPFYCEENVWHLASARGLARRRCRVAILSNQQDGVAMWGQRAAAEEGQPIVWDYHVVLLADSDDGWEVLDLDCRRGWPLTVEAWLQASFPFGDEVPPKFLPAVRLMEAGAYRETLSSDRSHMRDDDGEWIKEPPEWPPILDRERGMNLPELIDMSRDAPGEVVSFRAFRDEFESG
jgi:hypothetical protein